MTNPRRQHGEVEEYSTVPLAGGQGPKYFYGTDRSEGLIDCYCHTVRALFQLLVDIMCLSIT